MSMAEVDSETDEEVSLEDTLLLCARRGQYSVIEDILSSRKDGKIDLDINCKGMLAAFIMPSHRKIWGILFYCQSVCLSILSVQNLT